MNQLAVATRSRGIVPVAALVCVAVLVAAATSDRWLPLLATIATVDSHEHEDDGHRHDHEASGHSHAAAGHAHGTDDHGHSHAGHDDATALELSEVARKNIGLRTGVVEPQPYVRTVSVPARVAERAGRSQVGITAPFTGIVTRVHALAGEVIEPGEPLFELRLTHEDLVSAQRDYLQSAQELDVVKREITRLESAGEGVVAGRRVVEQKYEQEKIAAGMHAQRQGLLLHGLSESQVDEILDTRRLLPNFTVVAPEFPPDEDAHVEEHLFHVQIVNVKPGDHVATGTALATIADHCLLHVEGQAFEDDATQLIQAAREDWDVEVAPAAGSHQTHEHLSLKVLYVADHIDPDSRALHFYLSLENERLGGAEGAKQRFVAWRYRPGQRMEVHIPIGEPWTNQIVLPPEAVVEEGAEAFVFQQNDGHFDRTPVHVLYRDKHDVIVANDGSLVGTTVAMSGAYQMHLAIKQKAGGGAVPHGHSH